MSPSEPIEWQRVTLLLAEVTDAVGRLQRAGAVQRADRDTSALALDAAQARSVVAEQQATTARGMYIVARQLHAARRPADVIRALVDLAVNLLGAQGLAVVLGGPSSWRVAVRQDLDARAAGVFALDAYRSGDAVIDTALRGDVVIGERERSAFQAAIPIAVTEGVFGALAISSYMAHKGRVEGGDRELMSTLATHAGAAYLAACLHERGAPQVGGVFEFARDRAARP